jgi:hypothetical protein
MGGDDFQKKDSGLGLRDAITKKRLSIDSAATKRARELFDDMKIIQAVTNAIGQGKREVEITFPHTTRQVAPTTPFSGDIKWTTVIKRFTKLIQAEGVEVRVQNIGQYYNDPYDSNANNYHCIVLNF